MLPELPIEQRNMENTFKNMPPHPYYLIAAGQGFTKVTFPDGTQSTSDEIKKSLGYCQLFAWNLEQSALLKWVKFLTENPDHPCKLVVDSGAFSMWSRGKEFNMDEYINFLNSNNVIETAFWVAEADKIPGRFGVDPTPEEVAAAPQESWDNYLYMIKRVKYPKKIVPIFHMGEDFKFLDNMLSYQFEDGDFIPYIGISPRNDVHVNFKSTWYDQVWKFIFDRCNELGRDIPLTHNFGMTTISLMEQYPSCSSDSTSWLQSASYGNILIVNNGRIDVVCVSDRQLGSPNHILNKSKALQEAVEKECQRIGKGLTLNDLIYNDPTATLRKTFNLYSLHDWAMNYQYAGTDEFKEDLW